MKDDLTFSIQDFEGLITWPRITSTFSNVHRQDSLKNKGANYLFEFYHGCHFESLERYLRQGFIGMNSVINFDLPDYGIYSANGIWFSSVEREDSWYGPFVLSINSWAFSGRTFLVFILVTGII